MRAWTYQVELKCMLLEHSPKGTLLRHGSRIMNPRIHLGFPLSYECQQKFRTLVTFPPHGLPSFMRRLLKAPKIYYRPSLWTEIEFIYVVSTSDNNMNGNNNNNLFPLIPQSYSFALGRANKWRCVQIREIPVVVNKPTRKGKATWYWKYWYNA